MKKTYLLLLFFCLSVANVALAQQKTPVKKSNPPKIKPPKIYNVPPPPPVPKQTEVKTVNPPTPDVSYGPTIMADPSVSKFEKSMICQDCDTLTLDANKPNIVIYDVKWMADRQSRTFRKQPTEKDLTNNYFALQGLGKREWEELRKNFPEGDFSYHYVYRSTLITIPNKKQILSLLDRGERHEGFLYWSGKENDSIVSKKDMARLTETVASARGEKKTSSYYANFAKDSIAVVKFQQTKNPSPNFAGNMNVLLQQEIFDETILPVQFFNFDKVSKITIQSAKEANKQVVFKLNNKGQFVQLKERSDSTVITYKDNLPYQAIDRYKNTINFCYQGDTVIIKEKQYLKVNKMVDRMFFEVKRFNISKENYANMTLNNGADIKLSKNSNFCVTEYQDERDLALKTCYSNTNWELPLTLTNTRSYENESNKSEITYKLNDEKNLVLEEINSRKSTKLEYVITNGKPISIKSFSKRDNDEYGEAYVLNIIYEYFK